MKIAECTAECKFQPCESDRLVVILRPKCVSPKEDTNYMIALRRYKRIWGDWRPRSISLRKSVTGRHYHLWLHFRASICNSLRKNPNCKCAPWINQIKYSSITLEAHFICRISVAGTTLPARGRTSRRHACTVSKTLDDIWYLSCHHLEVCRFCACCVTGHGRHMYHRDN